MITANNTMLTAPAPAAAPTGNAYDISANLMGKGAQGFQDVMSGAYMGNINAYMNPFYESVINAALGRAETGYQQAMDQIGDAAQRSGAFGGTRHGVSEGVTTGEYLKNVGELTGNLQARNFDQASGAARADTFAGAGGLTSLGKDYFNIGQMLMGNQQAQGQQQQDLLNAILGQGNEMFSGYMQQPYKLIDMFNALMSGDVRRAQGTATATSTPGLLDYLALGAQAAGKIAGAPGTVG